jgi:hypothetical protein
MQRTRWLVVSVLLLVGAVWVGQGLGVLRGSSFMVGDPFWALAGAVAIAAAVVLAVLTARRRDAS